MDHAHALKRFSPIAGISFRSVPHLCVKSARVCVRVFTCLFVCRTGPEVPIMQRPLRAVQCARYNTHIVTATPHIFEVGRVH